MLKLAEIELLPAKVVREVTSPAQGVVIIDCLLSEDEGSREIVSVPLHWRAGDWSKPPIDIAFDAATGRFQNLQLVLQDESIAHHVSPAPERAALVAKTGVPIFEHTLWRDDERYIDEHFQPILSWEEQNSLLIIFASTPEAVQACLVDDSLTFLFNEQNEIIGFRLNQITREEKRIIRWAMQ